MSGNTKTKHNELCVDLDVFTKQFSFLSLSIINCHLLLLALSAPRKYEGCVIQMNSQPIKQLHNSASGLYQGSSFHILQFILVSVGCTSWFSICIFSDFQMLCVSTFVSVIAYFLFQSWLKTSVDHKTYAFIIHPLSFSFDVRVHGLLPVHLSEMLNQKPIYTTRTMWCFQLLS